MIFDKPNKIIRFYRLSLILFLCSSISIAAVEVRLGELVKVYGTRENQITGYGLVIGLPGTGDTRSAMTGEALQNYLNNLGVDSKLRPKDTRNIASVIVSANIPIWSQVGDKIDVTVSSIGDARSLEGGVLLQSPLKAGNGNTIAVASGNLQFGSSDDQGKRSGYSRKNQGKNAGLIMGGAIIEKEIPTRSILQTKEENKINKDDDSGNTDTKDMVPVQAKLRIQLLNPSYSTLNTILETLEEQFADLDIKPTVISKREFEINLPSSISPTSFLATFENIKIEPETPARVVINEKSGVIVMGGNLALDEVAFSKQGLNVKMESKGKSKYFWTNVDDKQESVFYIKKSNNVKSLVDELNKTGASTKDIISILQSLKQSGSLHAEVIVQ
ncbi:MAG: flagellar biosynthesis protein FlgA [Leptospira sp.]|nr:flagellar biosynthesis protein FlgA [Leptospira sp.]NCS94674.1 flagellar biosynthesis protein FlgA [Leptospira sp.]